MTDVICWSMKSRMVRRRAGTKARREYSTGNLGSKKGMIQPRCVC